MSPADTGVPQCVGVLGAGQLGRMFALEALRLGVQVRFLTPRDTGATEGVGLTTVGDWRSPAVLRAFMSGCTVLTVENEWAPLAEAEAAAAALGWPVVVKRRRGAYDGYGNHNAANRDELRQAWEALAEAPEGAFSGGVLLEAMVPFVRELAVGVARGADGSAVTYPVAYTEQADHRCAAVVVPAPIRPEVAAAAAALGQAVAAAFDVVGVCAVELFELADGTLLVNELAPRPHNSGHYSIEACHSSQYDNHLRAVLGWPLGDPSLRAAHAVMINLLGSRSGPTLVDGMAEAMAIPGVAVHLYGKRECRPGRKMGHLTMLGDDADDLRRRAEAAAELIRL
ncbi:MAG: ATP-grasp domain-containing protein [Myxococcales bacterium]|nr:ATP-grasp domain-containing protein [Myxococcales bacterium]